MLNRVRNGSRWLLSHVEKWFELAFTPAWNPFNHLGALTIFFFWVVLVSGIYVFIFFDTSVIGAYESVEWMTHEQWYLAGVMRSLHRYASDAAIITLAIHMLKEYLEGRYHGVRWFSWFTGIPLLWLVFPLGITGYWLVWDQLGQYVAIASSEMLDWFPIFTDPMARNFLTAASISDRFFTFMAFLHLIGLPIFLIFGVWFHVLRISRPRVNPPRGLAIGSLLAMTILSFIHPALSQGQADLAVIPTNLGFDWFYLFAYPLLDKGSPALLWGVLFGSSLLLSLLPWLPPGRRPSAAVVSLESCNGCGRCVDDCPYNAVSMGDRTDGSKYDSQAIVDIDLCTGCGICAGACPTSTPFRRRTKLIPGIDVPDHSIAALRKQTVVAAEKLSDKPRVLVYSCASGRDLKAITANGAAVVTLPCLAMLPPTFLDFIITRHIADGVLLMGCRRGDCHYRLGDEWTEQRLAGKRDPYLRKRVPRERIATVWGGYAGGSEFQQELKAFRARLQQLGPYDSSAQTPVSGDTAAGSRPS